jgi:hypothetical protein
MKEAIRHIFKLLTSQRFWIVAATIVLLVMITDKFAMGCITLIAIVLILCYTWKETQSTKQAVEDFKNLTKPDNEG